MVVVFDKGIETNEKYSLPEPDDPNEWKGNEWRKKEYENIGDMVVTFEKGVEVKEPFVLP